MDYSNTTVIIPTLNEEKNINKLIDLIVKLYPGINIIVADDGSNDQTQAIVRNLNKRNKKITLMDRSNEKIHGLCASVIDAAMQTKTENMVSIDGDFQHPPEKIKEIVEKLNYADIVIGNREKVMSKWPLRRKLISKIATILAKARLQMKGTIVKDPMSGFFGIRTKLMKSIIQKNGNKFEKKGYKILFDCLKYSPKVKVSNVNYIFGLRKSGTSKISGRIIWLFLKSVFR